MSSSGEIFDTPIDSIRRGIIEADSRAVVEGDQVVENPDRFDLVTREQQALELARLVGFREGLAVARIIVEKIANPDGTID